ncbi:MAG: hypothetical protein KTR33_11315, partial [Gammaproteobacteria bacterium]|nr:hypothetical protein [Gammaproteobacteria bacterium]
MSLKTLVRHSCRTVFVLVSLVLSTQVLAFQFLLVDGPTTINSTSAAEALLNNPGTNLQTNRESSVVNFNFGGDRGHFTPDIEFPYEETFVLRVGGSFALSTAG